MVDWGSGGLNDIINENVYFWGIQLWKSDAMPSGVFVLVIHVRKRQLGYGMR